MKGHMILGPGLPLVVLLYALPDAVAAVEIAGKALEVYGKLHMSLDLSDRDQAGESRDVSLSSNSSRIGFKGEHKIDDTQGVFWQIEQEVAPDEADGGSKNRFASRNTFLGLHSRYGDLLLGHHDTPFKLVGSKWDMFADTVGDRRAILGASAQDGNQMNERAKNSLLYRNTVGRIELLAMYATDAQDSAPGEVDDSARNLFSAGVNFTEGPLRLSAAYEGWQSLETYGAVDGLRIAATHKAGSGEVGVIYEVIDADNAGHLDRDAIGFKASYKEGGYLLKAQLMIADDHRGQANSGATALALGAFRAIGAQATTYVAFAVTDNDANAQFRGVDGGHGDEVPTVPGGSPNSLSAGFVFSF